MKTRMMNLIRSEEGQGMTEYIIIVALIAIAAIGVVTVFGQNLRAIFTASANALGGDESSGISKAGTKGGGHSAAKKGLGTTNNNTDWN